MKTTRIYFQDMLKYAQHAEEIAHEKGSDRLRKPAIERNLEIIGEAAKQIPRELQPNYPSIPWKDIIDLRNIISHEYDEFTLVELEQIVKEEIADLIQALVKILAEYQE